MKVKHAQLLRTLLDDEHANASTLAAKLNISVRSVKNYVREINFDNPNTITSSKDGYRVDPQIAKTLLESNNQNHIPQTSSERVTYIINQLIHHNGSNKVVDLYDLCDELYISLSTLKNEIIKVKRKLAKFDLQLLSKDSRIQVLGLENNKRKLLSSILYDESNVNFINLKSLQKSFIDIDIERIREIIITIFAKYQYFINDYSLINLILHITIAIDRVRNNYINNEDISKRPAVKLHEYNMAYELAEMIEQEFDVKFNPAEIYEMCLLIISRATTVDYKSIDESNVKEFIGEECLELVKLLISEMNRYYYINISEPEFLVRFALHIRNLLVRAQNNYYNKNPLTEGIKTSCPLIYDSAVFLANSLYKETGIMINDDEIAYIAFHLGSTLGEQKGLAEKINAVLYCPNYYDMNLRLIDSMRQHFKDELLIANILTDENDLEKIQDIDLIITTIPVSLSLITPIVQINIFFNEKDRNHLHDKIKQLQNIKKKEEFRKLLNEMIRPDFFIREKSFMNQEDCIDFMVNVLVENDYVEETFKEEVLYRESVSSTAFGNFAIPHAMKMNAKKTGMLIVVTDEAVEWGKYDVHLVIMMCFNKVERYLFNKTFEPITMILGEPLNLNKIIASKDYEEFIDLLVELL